MLQVNDDDTVTCFPPKMSYQQAWSRIQHYLILVIQPS
jgi:hypothetical protein